VVDSIDPLPGLYRRELQRHDRLNVLAADMILANSEYSRESVYRAYGVFARVGRLGVDTGRFRPSDSPRRDFVLSVGALNPRKGFDFLIRSLALIPLERRPPLLIVSNFVDGREQEFLVGLAASLGVNVSFRALVSDSELAELYGTALMTLYAPIMEPFGFVPLESMACATPVVGVREAGVRETVRDGETGILTDRDVAEFAAAVRRLLEDHVLRRRLGAQGRACVEAEWGWDRSLRILERHLASAADASDVART